MELAREHHPELIVVDLETVADEDDVIRREYAAALRSPAANLLVLGRVRGLGETLPPDRIVAKPYHFAPLIRTIEQILEAGAAASNG